MEYGTADVGLKYLNVMNFDDFPAVFYALLTLSASVHPSVPNPFHALVQWLEFLFVHSFAIFTHYVFFSFFFFFYLSVSTSFVYWFFVFAALVVFHVLKYALRFGYNVVS